MLVSVRRYVLASLGMFQSVSPFGRFSWAYDFVGFSLLLTMIAPRRIVGRWTSLKLLFQLKPNFFLLLFYRRQSKNGANFPDVNEFLCLDVFIVVGVR